MESNPFFSIIILTFENSLRRQLFLKTVEIALNQVSEKPFEILVVDGPGFSKNSLIGKIRYIHPPNEDVAKKHYGRALKRNAAVLLAKGEYVVFFDDDDYRSPDSLITQFSLMQKAQADISTLQVSHVCEIDKLNKKVRYLKLDNSLEGAPFSKKYGNAGTIMFKKQIFIENLKLGFPESEIEDLRFIDLLIGKSTLSLFREKTYKHLLIYENLQTSKKPIYMYVRLKTSSKNVHVWNSFNCEKFSNEISPNDFLDEKMIQFYEQIALLEDEEKPLSNLEVSKEYELEYFSVQKDAKQRTEQATQSDIIVRLLNAKK